MSKRAASDPTSASARASPVASTTTRVTVAMRVNDADGGGALARGRGRADRAAARADRRSNADGGHMHPLHDDVERPDETTERRRGRRGRGRDTAAPPAAPTPQAPARRPQVDEGDGHDAEHERDAEGEQVRPRGSGRGAAGWARRRAPSRPRPTRRGRRHADDGGDPRSTMTPPDGSSPRVHEQAASTRRRRTGRGRVEQPATDGGQRLGPRRGVQQVDDHHAAGRLADAEGEGARFDVSVDRRDRPPVDRVDAVGERRGRRSPAWTACRPGRPAGAETPGTGAPLRVEDA